MYKYKFIYLILIISIISYAEAEILKIHYQTRPPLYITDPITKKLVDGQIYKLANRILVGSKVPFKFEESPLMRSIAEIKKNKSPICYISVYKSKDREDISIFSAPYYREKRMIITIRKDDLRFNKYKTVVDILKDNNLITVVRNGASYGEYIDNNLKIFKNYSHLKTEKIDSKIVKVISTTPINTLEIIAKKEADYTFVPESEFNFLISENKFLKNNLKSKEVNDIKQGNLRYFMCSKVTGIETMAKINQEIKKITKWD